MRWCYVVAALGALLCVPQKTTAAVLVRVDVSRQAMAVSVDGVRRYNWPISTARQGFITPNGFYRPQRLARHWRSGRYGSAMPYAIFFHRGWAIHGTSDVRRLGRPASAGCIRLHPSHAAVLFGLVRNARSTSIVISGSRPTMLANGAGRQPTPGAARPIATRRFALPVRAFSARRYAPYAYHVPRSNEAASFRGARRHFSPRWGYGPPAAYVIVEPIRR